MRARASRAVMAFSVTCRPKYRNALSSSPRTSGGSLNYNPLTEGIPQVTSTPHWYNLSCPDAGKRGLPKIVPAMWVQRQETWRGQPLEPDSAVTVFSTDEVRVRVYGGGLVAKSFSFKTTICGVEEIDRMQIEDVSHIISILDPYEPLSPACQKLPRHSMLELRFHDAVVPGPGIVLPTDNHVKQLLRFCQERIVDHSAHLLIHCQAGQSRSTAAAALCLIQVHPTRSAYEILGQIVRMRPAAWPNLRLVELGDEILGRHGELVTAVAALYRRKLNTDPGLADHLRRHGRGR